MIQFSHKNRNKVTAVQTANLLKIEFLSTQFQDDFFYTFPHKYNF